MAAFTWGSEYAIATHASATLWASSICVLDSTHLLLSYYNSAARAAVKVAVYSGSTISSVGSEYALMDARNGAYATSVCALTSSLVVCLYDNDYTPGLEVVAATISGTTVTKGTLQAVITGSESGAKVVRLDDSHFVMIWKIGNNCTVQCGSVSGTSITLGTAVNLQTNSYYGKSPDVTRLDDTHFVVSYGGKSTSEWDAVVQCCSVSGTTITAGTALTAGSVAGTAFSKVARLTDTTFVVIYDKSGDNKVYSKVGSVSGTTITLGSEDLARNPKYQSAYKTMGLEALSSTLVAYYDRASADGKGYLVQGTISGTAISWAADEKFRDTTILQADYHLNGAARIDNSTVAICYTDNTNKDIYAIIGNISIVFTYSGSGSMTLSGIAVIQPETTDYIWRLTSGAMGLSGTAAKTYDRTFSKTMSGGAALSGTVVRAVIRIVSTSGSATLSGTADYGTNYYRAAGTVTISGAAQTYRDRFFTASGSAAFSGSGTYALSSAGFLYSGSGGFALSKDCFSSYYLNLDIAFITKDNVAGFALSIYQPNSAPPAGGYHGYHRPSLARIDDNSFLYVAEQRVMNSEGNQSSLKIVSGIGTFTDIAAEPQININQDVYTEIVGSDNLYVSNLFKIKTGKYLAICENPSPSNDSKIFIIEVSGSTITHGSLVTILNLKSSSRYSVAVISDTVFVLVGYGSTNKLKAVVGTISGNSITLGTIVDNSDMSGVVFPVYKLSDTKVIVRGRATVSTSNRRFSIGTISGDSISFGAYYEDTDQTINTTNCGFVRSTASEVLSWDEVSGTIRFKKLTYSSSAVTSHTTVKTIAGAVNNPSSILISSHDNNVLYQLIESYGPNTRTDSPPLTSDKIQSRLLRIPSVDSVIDYTPRVFDVPYPYDYFEYNDWGMLNTGNGNIAVKLSDNRVAFCFFTIAAYNDNEETFPEGAPGELFRHLFCSTVFIVSETFWNQVYLSSGSVTMAGSAARSITINVSASGSITIGGTAAKSISIICTVSGTVYLSGTAAKTISFTRTCSGGVSITGTAPPQEVSVIYSASGSVSISGAADYGTNYYRAAGTVTISGAAQTYRDRFFTASGSVSISGSSAYNHSRNFTASLTGARVITLSGYSIISRELFYSPELYPIILRGTALSSSTTSYFASGGIVISGSASIVGGARYYIYRATGGIVVSGSAAYARAYVRYLYSARYPRGPITLSGTAAKTYYKIFVKSMSGSISFHGGAWYTNKPVFIFISSGGFTLYGSTSAFREYFAARVSGGLRWGGGATWFAYRHYTGTGLIRLSGHASGGLVKDFQYSPSGHITLSGSPRYKFVPTEIYLPGGVGTLGGHAVSTYTWKYRYIASGAASLSGSSTTLLFSRIYKYLSSGKVTTGGAASYFRFVPKHYTMHGGILVRGYSNYQYNKILSYSASGTATFRGTAQYRLFSKKWVYVPSGGIALSGTAAKRLSITSLVGGIGYLTGHAVSLYSKKITALVSGRAVLSGTATKQYSKIYVYTASGGMVLSTPTVQVVEILAFNSKLTTTLAFDSPVTLTMSIDSEVDSTLEFYSEIRRIA